MQHCFTKELKKLDGSQKHLHLEVFLYHNFMKYNVYFGLSGASPLHTK